MQIGGEVTLGQGLGHGLLDGLSGSFLTQAVAQHQGGREDLGDGVGNPFAGDIGGRTTGRFEQAETRFVEAGRGEQPHGAGDHGALVGEDVTEQVGAEQHVELGGILDELHGGVVDIHMVQRHVRVGFGDFGHHLAPQNGGGEHVGLVDGGDLATAHTSRFERYLGDALDFEAVVHLGVECLLVRSFSLASLGLAEVDAAGQLTHTGDVKTAIGDIGAQG